MSIKFKAFFILIIFCQGCATIPEDALKLSHESLKNRQLQSRRFNRAVMSDLVSATAGVAQDLGYSIEETEPELGIIVGSKKRSAKQAGQVAAAIFLAVLGGGATPIDDVQVIRCSIFVKPLSIHQVHQNRRLANVAQSYVVRVTFQRIVWNTAKQVTLREAIENPDIYRKFFEKLSKSIFLEAHKI